MEDEYSTLTEYVINHFFLKELVFESDINYENMVNYANEYKVIIKPFSQQKIKNSEMLPGRSYSVFGFVIRFTRHINPYIYGYYLTSLSVVIIAGNVYFSLLAQIESINTFSK